MVLISKTKTLKDLEAHLSIKSYCEWAKGYDEGLRDAIRVVKCQNHIEAEPVLCGQWDESTVPFCNVCTNCGAVVERHCVKSNGSLKRCPNCGAKMVGGGEDGKNS